MRTTRLILSRARQLSQTNITTTTTTRTSLFHSPNRISPGRVACANGIPLGLSRTRCYSTTQPQRHISNSSSSSIDPNEISHFDALASTWWNPRGPSRLLHLMNPVRIDFIKSCIRQGSGGRGGERQLEGLKYLDIGCGGGIFAESAARLPGTSSVTGIDPSADVLSVAIAHARKDPGLKGKLEYVNASVDQMVDYSFPQNVPPTSSSSSSSSPSDTAAAAATSARKPQQYDVVTLFEVAEHVPYPAPFLRKCMQLVKPGGWLIGSTISRTWTSWLTTIVAAENVLGIVPPGTHDWSRYINSDELVEFFHGEEGWGNLEKGGFVRIMGVAYVPGIGWKVFSGAEGFGNYFFAARKEVKE